MPRTQHAVAELFVISIIAEMFNCLLLNGNVSTEATVCFVPANNSCVISIICVITHDETLIRPESPRPNLFTGIW